MPFRLFFVFLIGFFFSCDTNSRKKEEDTQFSALSHEQTGVSFENTLTENDSLNYFSYSYLYMGGGVSVGDINNDGLDDLFFTGNMVPNKLYLNQGDLKFKDVTQDAGLEGDERWFTGVTMADVNGDGFLDIYCSVAGKFTPKGNMLYINNTDGTFTEKALDYGIDDRGNSVQGTFFDYDLDGDLDLYVANYPETKFTAPNDYYLFKMDTVTDEESDSFYRNDGEVFTNITDEAGLRSFGLSLSATVGDLNNDGWPDLYVSNDFSTPDYMYINNQDGTFDEVVKTATKQTSFYGMGVDIADYNNDGLLDFIQVDMDAQDNRRSKSNMASMNPMIFWSTVDAGFHHQYMHNSLQLNNGNFSDRIPDFSNSSRLAGLSSTDWSWGPLFTDLDNDGWKDVYISNGSRREINNKDYFNKLGRNPNKRDSLLQKSLAIPSEKIDNFTYRNKGDLTFEKVNDTWGITYEGFSNGSTYADLDNDGDLEIITNNIDDFASIFQNNNKSKNNFLSFEFKGYKKNAFGLGARVYLKNSDQEQMQELTLTRGFQSSVAPKLYFGLGKTTQVSEVKIVWPDQKVQLLKEVKANQKIVVDYGNASYTRREEVSKKTTLFTTIASDTLGVAHEHVENIYDDFEKEILLPHKTSMFGPGLAIGDLNNDGLEDFYMGGASQYPGGLYFQTDDGFEQQDAEFLEIDSLYEDLGAVIFDADNDGDNDLYVVSGGNEFDKSSKWLQDRLYVNDGAGNLKKSTEALPKMITSGSRVYTNDYDKDGDLDVFVGGRLIPGNYPLPANSYLLQNDSKNGIPKFTDATLEKAPDLNGLGMVTSATWTDYDQDGWTDLIVVGEWMPIQVFQNQQGVLENVSKEIGLKNTNGWWFSIKDGDFDNDGDKDFIVGNLGLNYKYQAKKEETFDVYFYDFDSNNTNDIVLSYFNDGKKFPVRGRECSAQQMPGIKSKFENYDSFAQADLEDIYTETYLEDALHYQVQSFASVYLENTPSGFVSKELPIEAQMSPINQILVKDIDQDGNLDVVVAGNLHTSEVETPRADAGIGLVLKGDGQGSFSALNARDSGFYTSGDVKDLALIKIKDSTFIISVKNNDYLQFIKLNENDYELDF